MLTLSRPLAFIDIETTGINIGSDRIVEISILVAVPEGTTRIKTQRVNPGMPIPEGASKIHGIYDDDVKDMPSFKTVAHELNEYLSNCDIGGYNSNRFDIPLLVEEFLRAGIDFDMRKRKLVDVQNIFHKMEQRTLSAAYKFYCGKELVDAHSAEADIKATYEILLAQIERYHLKGDMDTLQQFSNTSGSIDLAGRIVKNEKGEAVFNFGKHKGKAVEQVFKAEPSYYDWMMNGDFTQNTKKVITELRLKAFNKP